MGVEPDLSDLFEESVAHATFEHPFRAVGTQAGDGIRAGLAQANAAQGSDELPWIGPGLGFLRYRLAIICGQAAIGLHEELVPASADNNRNVD
ncbi:MAG: hypothetical protein ACE5I2_07575, partial [Anaerolineae bacterium]